ncbi:hypothetical protein [Morganella morganii]|uniref:hypothetical protein n=1 Tax=Morganella morganii TaxID=582 RepID=UPI0005094DEF|nr:hypothetical protein [Morganella morganii]
MDNKEELEKLVNYISISTVNVDDGFVFIENNLDINSNHDFSVLLLKFGIKEIITKEEGCVVFKASVSNFTTDSNIYVSLDNFWGKCSRSGVFNRNYIILKEKIFYSSKSDEIVKIEAFLNWKEVLCLTANHIIESKYVLYIPDNDGGKELIINNHYDLNAVLEISVTEELLLSALELIKVLTLKDAQQKERVSILRSAIFDVINECDNKDLFQLIDKGSKVYIRYNDLLDLYTKRFSVNKILSELEQKHLEYTTKINEFISNSQSKAFAIPGALIAVGGLAKASDLLDSILILIGLFFIYQVTRISNDVLKESYNSLEESLMELVGRYYKFDEGAEVRNAASSFESDIKDQIKNAKIRIDKINNMSILMLAVGGLYLGCKWIFLLADQYN